MSRPSISEELLARSKERRDPEPHFAITETSLPPFKVEIKKSYYHSPADQDFLYKFQALFKPVTALSLASGVYDGYAMKSYRTAGPLLARVVAHMIPGYVAAGIFVGSNAIAVKINGEDTSWCHFTGGFSTWAFISWYFRLGLIWPVAYIIGLGAVRYRFTRVREIRDGVPMYHHRLGYYGEKAMPSLFTRSCVIPPIVKMPPEFPEL